MSWIAWIVATVYSNHLRFTTDDLSIAILPELPCLLMSISASISPFVKEDLYSLINASRPSLFLFCFFGGISIFCFFDILSSSSSLLSSNLMTLSLLPFVSLFFASSFRARFFSRWRAPRPFLISFFFLSVESFSFFSIFCFILFASFWATFSACCLALTLFST